MKKYIFLALLIPTLSFASIDGNLKYGASGGQVMELQDFLFGKGFLSVKPTGYFYYMTLQAVKLYQSSVGLPSTGFVGPLTRASINAELSTELASSTEAEVQETGTTTPIVIEPTPVQVTQPVQAPQNPSPSPIINNQPTMQPQQPVDQFQLQFLTQPSPRPLMQDSGYYIYPGQDDTWKVNMNLEKVPVSLNEVCNPPLVDHLDKGVGRTVTPGQTYTCTLTVNAGNYSVTSDPYTFTVPSN